MIKKLHELHEAQFADELHKVVSHSRPIDDERHLKGREEQLKLVGQAIHAPGRHIFVFGERGVGKTSLAKTAGLRAADGSANFRHIGCSSTLSFDELLRLIIGHFDPPTNPNVARARSENDLARAAIPPTSKNIAIMIAMDALLEVGIENGLLTMKETVPNATGVSGNPMSRIKIRRV